MNPSTGRQFQVSGGVLVGIRAVICRGILACTPIAVLRSEAGGSLIAIGPYLSAMDIACRRSAALLTAQQDDVIDSQEAS